ncbi:MAG: hypothetical protein HKN20_13605 [Gemmatimonadetes bacterium]|nr:hypothetical protein [Gemmatimonadota bacterium]
MSSEARRINEGEEVSILEPKAEVRSGLCSTCTQAAVCTFPREFDRPIMFCDEFEGEKKPPVHVVRQSAATVEVAEFVAAEAAVMPRGLCRTCDHQETCTFPRPESGVWFCEEFE